MRNLSGNHAQGVALAAKRLGIPAKIVMPVPTPAIKVNTVAAVLSMWDHNNTKAFLCL
jgi:threonine dehydratase